MQDFKKKRQMFWIKFIIKEFEKYLFRLYRNLKSKINPTSWLIQISGSKKHA